MAEHHSTIISTEDMREPTHLELAQMFMIQSQATLSLINFVLLERDILTTEEEFAEALQEVKVSMQTLTQWWINLKPEGENPLEDDTESGDPEFI
jgi:hypothetical protein